MIKKIIWSLAYLFWAAKTFAAETTVPVPGAGDCGADPEKGEICLDSPLGSQTFATLLQSIINYLIIVAVPILTIMVLIGGFQMLTAGDNENRFKQGKKTLTYAAIGAIVILASSGLLFVLGEILGIDSSKLEQTLP